jgi:hypothetical protein
MAKWRSDYIAWMRRAEATNDFFALSVPSNTPAIKFGTNALSQAQTQGSK